VGPRVFRRSGRETCAYSKLAHVPVQGGITDTRHPHALRQLHWGHNPPFSDLPVLFIFRQLSHAVSAYSIPQTQ